MASDGGDRRRSWRRWGVDGDPRGTCGGGEPGKRARFLHRHGIALLCETAYVENDVRAGGGFRGDGRWWMWRRRIAPSTRAARERGRLYQQGTAGSGGVARGDAVEMEAAAIFTVALARGLEAWCICLAVDRVGAHETWAGDEAIANGETALLRMAFDSVLALENMGA
jgi:hypothetical protein